MVEVVARALNSSLGHEEKFWLLAIPHARAAIKAMLEPTEAMAYAGSWAVGSGGDRAKMQECAKVYRAMIQAALGEKSDG